MSIPGNGAAETPSGADLAEDVAGSPPEEADDVDEDGSETPSDDDIDEDEEGDEPAEDEDESEDEQEADPREELIASLTPEQQREFKRLENDSRRLGRFAKQNKILARRLEALESRLEEGGKREETPDPRISSIDKEIAELGPQIQKIHGTWKQAYQALDESRSKLNVLRAKIKEAGDDEYARGNLESRADSLEANVRALELRCEREQERYETTTRRLKELSEGKPAAEREAKEERARREQERERQARQLADFPGQVEKMVHASATEVGIPISRKSEAVRYGHFVDAVKARVANFLVARGQAGKPMATMKQVAAAVRKAIEFEAVVIGSRKPEQRHPPGTKTVQTKTRPQLTKPAAPRVGTEQLTPQQEYEAYKAQVARRARALN